jgi:S1-C subfamily serine protease
VATAPARWRLHFIRTTLAVGLVALTTVACGSHQPAATGASGASALHGGTNAGARLDLGLVAISAKIGNREVRSSGTVVDGDRGLILTSAHSVWGASSLKLATGVAVLHGRIVARSPCDDIALVETQPWVPGLAALPQATAPLTPGPITAVGRRWADDGSGIRSTPAQAEPGRRSLPLLAEIARSVRLRGALAPEASGGPVLDAQGRILGITDVAGGQAVAVPMSLISERLDALRPGPGTVYVGWSEYYRCAPRQHAYAAATYPGFRRSDARLNAPVPASRLRGTRDLDR